MTAALSLWAWVEIALVTLVGFLVQTVLWLVCLPFDRKRLVAGRTFRLVGVVAAKLNPFWRFGVAGAAARPSGKTVVVSNHESNADPFLVSFLPWEMKWLGKASLFRIPVVGLDDADGGGHPRERGDSDSARAAMAVCVRWLERGVPVMLFPEGTRSRDGQLLPFKDGAFRLAIETGADVLPWPSPGRRPALPKHSWKFGAGRRTGHRGDAHLHRRHEPGRRRGAEGPGPREEGSGRGAQRAPGGGADRPVVTLTRLLRRRRRRQPRRNSEGVSPNA